MLVRLFVCCKQSFNSITLSGEIKKVSNELLEVRCLFEWPFLYCEPADSPENVRDSDCYNFLSGVLLNDLIFRMKYICLIIIVSIQAWLNKLTWHVGDTSPNCHMTVKSHDMPDKNSIGSYSIPTPQTILEFGTRRWNITMKGRFCNDDRLKVI